MELRCGSKILHGIVDGDTVEVVCRSRWCGKRPGVVVLHKFSVSTGELIQTTLLQEPKEDASNGTRKQGTAVRYAPDQAHASQC